MVVTASVAFHRDAHAAWPPAPGADLTDPSNWPDDPDYSGYWNVFSYLPVQAAGTPPYLDADVALGASGMSVDLAWETTIGSPDVRIAVIDSGIEWEEPDLVNKAWLNAVELEHHKPLQADGSPCGGAGALAGYDCDGDGVFTVADYANDPTLTPIVPDDPCTNPRSGAQGPRMQGDVNYNCILDAGDLIQLYSDGIDDDGNGYVDDISGWDFYKDDNNPYDDARYGHGTDEALDSSAEGNNSLEGIGVCPLCRFVLLRTGNSFLSSSNNFAKGVVYATDNGFNVASAAMGGFNLTAFGRAAIDYAYAHDVLVVAAMADENSRHHNLPSTYNHTFPVHAIAYDGSSETTSMTFVDFVHCSNFGGQSTVSVSATACSSDATGKTAGNSGLLYSYAAALGLSPPLTAEEVMQLQKMTADVIDVPQSRVPGQTTYYESLPGFSQRFGYGRTNVPKALAAMKSGLIPPEVEILSPGWFETLYEGRGPGAVPVVARIVAARATSYDYTVEWAPGVEPPDSDFTTLLPTVSSVPGATVTGGASAPLVMLDPASINTGHTPDPDSPHHENDRTITVRVQVVAHYPGGDASGEARRSIAIVNAMNGLDTDLLPGFPLQLGGSVEGGPKLADIDGDGVRDIVLTTSDGSVHVFSVSGGSPAEIAGFPYLLLPVDGLDPHPTQSSLPSYLNAPAYVAGANGGIDPAVTREGVVGSAAIGDVSGDASLEVVFASVEGTVYVVDSAGNDVAGWPVRLPEVPSCPQDPHTTPPAGECMDPLHDVARGAIASPVLTDFDGDGKLEVVLAAFDGNVYVWNGDGSMRSGFPVLVHSPLAYKTDLITTTPAVADLNGDGIPDIAVGSDETIGNEGGTGFYYVIDGRGTAAPGGPYLPSWPVEVSSEYVLPVLGEGTNASPAILDLDGDGSPDVFLQGNAQVAPLVLPGNPGPQSGDNPPATLLPLRPLDHTNGFNNGNLWGLLSNATIPGDIFLPVFSHPSVGDLDQDGVPDVVESGAGISLAENLSEKTAAPFEHLLGMWSGATGNQMPGSPYVIEDYSFITNQAVADITGDDYPEVLQGTGGYFVHAVDACGREAPNWPKFTGGWITATPAVGDINGDHTLEVVDATRDGYLYAWTTKGSDTGVVAWESFHHDNANTGNYGTALDQGVLERAKTPLDCTPPDAGPPDAGAHDAGAHDAGKETRPDASKGSSVGVDAGTDASAHAASSSGGGCGCIVGSRSQPGTVAPWLAIGGAGLTRLRRRRRAPAPIGGSTRSDAISGSRAARVR